VGPRGSQSQDPPLQKSQGRATRRDKAVDFISALVETPLRAYDGRASQRASVRLTNCHLETWLYYVFIEMIALGFVLASIEAFVNGRPWFISLICLVCGLICFLAGIKWPKIKLLVGARVASSVDRIAHDSRYRSGLILLLMGCVAILYRHSLRSDLDTYAMPRSITDKQAKDLRDYLSQREAHAITVKVNPVGERPANTQENCLVLLSVRIGTQRSVPPTVPR